MRQSPASAEVSKDRPSGDQRTQATRLSLEASSRTSPLPVSRTHIVLGDHTPELAGERYKSCRPSADQSGLSLEPILRWVARLGLASNLPVARSSSAI